MSNSAGQTSGRVASSLIVDRLVEHRNSLSRLHEHLQQFISRLGLNDAPTPAGLNTIGDKPESRDLPSLLADIETLSNRIANNVEHLASRF